MLVVSGIRIPLDLESFEAIDCAKKKLGLRGEDVAVAEVQRVSLDARHGSIYKVCSVSLALHDPALERSLAARNKDAALRGAVNYAPKPGGEPLCGRAIVVGFGPAGLFAALALARAGYRPLVLERGPEIDERAAAVELFNRTGALDPNANIQFGEGGAGAFSDGKLTSRGNDELGGYILKTLCAFGAPREVLWQAKPHIGTDLLRGVVKKIRAEVLALGGEIRFNTPLIGLAIKNYQLRAAKTPDGELETGALILASGHSARDVFALCAESQLSMAQKPFSVGLRIEHLQQDIDKALWGRFAGHEQLPKGEYALSARAPGGEGVYTFCMCPGGSVVAAASEPGGAVTNGMSLHDRGGENANAAVCTGVGPAQLGGGVFAGLDYQRRIEQLAFAMGGGEFRAPAADVGHFLQKAKGLDISSVKPSYPRGVTPADLDALLGARVCDSLRFGIAAFGKKLRGFDSAAAILTGPETRTSSPVRIVRGEDYQSPEAAGLYPCGEGAGYAGGIMSAAADGLRVAAAIISRFKPTN